VGSVLANTDPTPFRSMPDGGEAGYPA